MDSTNPPVERLYHGTMSFHLLQEHELWWVEHADVLEHHGYRLRTRYRPGWVPSWQGTDKMPCDCEDSYLQFVCSFETNFMHSL